MVEVGDRVVVESEKVGTLTRGGVVMAVEGRLITVRWGIPAPSRSSSQAPDRCESRATSPSWGGQRLLSQPEAVPQVPSPLDELGAARPCVVVGRILP